MCIIIIIVHQRTADVDGRPNTQNSGLTANDSFCSKTLKCCIFLETNVRARYAFLSCSYALLLHLIEMFNERINYDDDDNGNDARTYRFICMPACLSHAAVYLHG